MEPIDKNMEIAKNALLKCVQKAQKRREEVEHAPDTFELHKSHVLMDIRIPESTLQDYAWMARIDNEYDSVTYLRYKGKWRIDIPGFYREHPDLERLEE